MTTITEGRERVKNTAKSRVCNSNGNVVDGDSSDLSPQDSSSFGRLVTIWRPQINIHDASLTPDPCQRRKGGVCEQICAAVLALISLARQSAR